MAIIIPSYAAGAITSYPDLIAEIRDLMDDEDFDQQKIDRALRKAEALFNRELRVTDMETRTVFIVSGELSPLPMDFLQMRTLFYEGSPDRLLKSMAPATVTGAYGGRDGIPQAYSIEGNMIRIAPVGAATLEMSYYASLTPLSDASVSNWLLKKHPDLYIAGAMSHLSLRERDNEGYSLWTGQVTALLQSINEASSRNRWGASPLVPAGVAQVRGARA